MSVDERLAVSVDNKHIMCQCKRSVWCVKVEGACGVSRKRGHVCIKVEGHVVCQGRGGLCVSR